jgi:DNA polymerase II large subunit
MKKKIYNLIVLDESGSMFDISQATISGLNETIQTISNGRKKNKNQEHFLSLVSFNSHRMLYHYDLTPVEEIETFDGQKYDPNFCTPLYDAIGFSLSKLRRQITDDDMVLVTIITDGLENDSKEYNYDSVTKTIDSLKAKGWVITYIGANQDAIAEAHKMHIDHGLSYNATPEGVENMMAFERSKRDAVYTLMERCIDPKELSELDYFA